MELLNKKVSDSGFSGQFFSSVNKGKHKQNRKAGFVLFYDEG